MPGNCFGRHNFLDSNPIFIVMNILVTPEVDPQQQQLIQDLLASGQTTVRFLPDIPQHDRKQALQEAQILLTFNPVRNLSKAEFRYLDTLRFMQLISAGADHLPYEKLPEDITLASNTGAYSKPIAEHVVAMTLALAKRLREEHSNMQNGEFNQFAKNKFIADSTVGILGFGGIGQATARLFRAFGSRIFAMNTTGETNEPTYFIGTSDDLQHILQASDIVVLSLPLNKHTREMIARPQLKWMPSDGILINVARGEIINQRDLYEHLSEHPEFKAGLESWWVEPLRHGSLELEYPFLDLPNVLASPHNSSMVPGIMTHGIAEAAKNIKRFINGETFKGEIDRTNFV